MENVPVLTNALCDHDPQQRRFMESPYLRIWTRIGTPKALRPGSPCAQPARPPSRQRPGGRQSSAALAAARLVAGSEAFGRTVTSRPTSRPKAPAGWRSPRPWRLSSSSARLWAWFVILAVQLMAGTAAFGAVPGAEHVVIIGCDGLSPDGIRKANTPVMDRLMKEGAFTLQARGVMPTSSSPNWASMIMGAGPEQHGVTSNDWQTNKFEIAPTAVGPGGIFPTIFSLLREQKPGAVMAVFHDWDGFGRLFERQCVNFIEDSEGPTNAVRHAVAYLREKKPAFMFIHLDHVDHVGHHDGHGTPAYYASVEVADKLIGEVIDGLRQAGLAEKTILLITSDHGGKGKGHGGATMAEIEIPWILHGPGVAAGKEIQSPVNTFDTAATVAHIFGLKPPSCWIAKPVLEAFQ